MSPADRSFARHDLVWLDGPRWRDALRAPIPDEWMDILDAWFGRDRPAVVRRQESLAATALSIGVALPPARGKLKLPLLVDRAAVIRTSSPLTLATAASSAGDDWRPWLERLAADARSVGVEFNVYGSLAWQHLTGESYLTVASDVDLLWRAHEAATLQGGLDLLARWERASGLRADGELLLPDGSAIAWKELAARPRKVLVKQAASVELRATDKVLPQLRTVSC